MPALDGAEPAAEKVEDVIGGAAVDWQSGAVIRSGGREAGNDRVAACCERFVQRVRVGAPIIPVDEEVQDGAVMPDEVAARRTPREQVGRDPGDALGALPESVLRQRERRVRDIEHGQISVSGGQQRTRQPRRAAPDVKDRGIPIGHYAFDRTQRVGRAPLIPTALFIAAGKGSVPVGCPIYARQDCIVPRYWPVVMSRTGVAAV
jgi:hypothetical protein